MSKLRLKIADFVPHIFLVEKDKLTQITHESENLLTLIEKVAEILEIKKSSGSIDENKKFDEYLNKARESDENYVKLRIEQGSDSQEFELSKSIESALIEVNTKTMSELSKLKNLDNDELFEQLNEYRKQDILASTLSTVYDIFVTKLLIAANELEIFEFELEDLHGNAALAEHLTKVFREIGFAFSIVKN